MNKSPLAQRPDYLVCTCMGVMYSQLVDSIKNGAKTFHELAAIWEVGTGCSSCIAEVNEILAEELRRGE